MFVLTLGCVSYSRHVENMMEPMISEMSPTAAKVLRASRNLFNEQGFRATTVAEIAAAAGIAPGNVTYHFPTKHDMVVALRKDAARRMEERRRARGDHELVERYVLRLVDVYEVAADYRFLLRDRQQFRDVDDDAPPPESMVADFAELRALLEEVRAAGLLRSDIELDLDLIGRTLWILGRHWPDHLREVEQRTALTAADRRRGMEHHFSILLPTLTAEARRNFQQALDNLVPTN